MEFRAALLASRGFVTLALGYIFYDEDPAYKEELEYFEVIALYVDLSELQIHGFDIEGNDIWQSYF